MVYARATGLVRVPEELNPLEAALLLCAGVTTFNALRNADAPFGALVAGLAPRGQLVVVGGATDPIAVQITDLIFGGQTWRSASTTTSSR